MDKVNKPSNFETVSWLDYTWMGNLTEEIPYTNVYMNFYNYSFIDVTCHEIQKHLIIGALNSCRNYFLYTDSYIVVMKVERGNLSGLERERERARSSRLRC
jgi:hypothetical protein